MVFLNSINIPLTAVPLVATTSMEAILLRLSSSIDKLEQRFVDTDSNTHAELEWKKVCILISVRSWNFKDGGSLKASFSAKNQHATKEKIFKEIP
jgi:hypothetical protein